MRQTPLFAAHSARGAAIDVVDDFMLPVRFAGVDAEVEAARAGAGAVDLAHVESVVLSNPDVRRWCNGMFTNDVRRLGPGQGCRTAMCDDRGRVLALADLYVLAGDRVLVVLEGATAGWFAGRYEMFLTLDDIELHDLSGEARLLSVQGPAAADVLGRMGLPVPPDAMVEAVDGFRVLRRDRTGLGGFDLLVPVAALASTWEAILASGAVPMGHEALEALRILAGQARWPRDGSDRSFVHELRLERIAVSFDKGCYVGQEIINRVETHGQVTKRLMGLVLREDAVPPAGAEVVLGSDVVGSVSSAARVGGRAYALGTLRRSASEPGTAVVIRAGEREVGAVVSELPFGG